MNAFDVPEVVILGGSSKGSDFTVLSKELAKRDVFAIILGEEKDNIVKACQLAGFSNYYVMDGPDAVKMVKKASELAKPGSVVLLSPACASFGLFKNYIDRGDQFTKAVNRL